MTLHEVVCNGCNRGHVMSEARAREQRVLRCDCGHFVRLDRGLGESDLPADLDDADHDEATRMVSSLSEIEGAAGAFGLAVAQAPAESARASSVESELSDASEEDEATRMVSSPLTLSSLLPQATKSDGVASSSTPAKPVWYVDLGAGGTIEMTIEKLIMARRSGKIGESALVWRPGMARWRPVGTLIAAAGTGVARPGAEPRSKPSNPKPSQPTPPSAPRSTPARREEPGPSALAVYERPAATLEFALEDQRSAPPEPSSPSTREAGRAPAADPARSRSVPPVARSTASAAPRAAAALPRGARAALLRSLPKWVTILVPALACTVLAIAGALVVRALRAPRPLPALSAAPATAAKIAAPKPVTKAEPEPSAALTGDAGDAPIIDVDSLSLEKRPAPRPKLAALSEPRAASPTGGGDPVPADSDQAQPNQKARSESTDQGQTGRDAGAPKDTGALKNRLPELGEQDKNNPFYNPGF
jgi:hypothetical protein